MREEKAYSYLNGGNVAEISLPSLLQHRGRGP